MTRETWAEVRNLVEAATAFPPAERAAFLAASGVAPEVLIEAEDLLACSADASIVLSVDNWRLNADALESPEALSGKLFGHYRILRLLGRGGMGSVYLAERADGVYQQLVALKAVQVHLTDEADSARLTQRFTAERQILARLTHPGIARLLDGGITADRQPFLVLEYVDGLPIDAFCTQHNLTLTAKLRLFLRLCEAVQFAHQQLVLHLDIKPANILVTAEGEPRLLDFGIARLLTPEGHAEQTLRLLTPRFASPEQATGAPLGVASDIFSLGTLLYKLLTGHFPYPVDAATPLDAARMIADAAPQLPSLAISAPDALALRGDLDLILLQALRKEPTRRYPTVAAFASDIQRFLDFQPVQAHADTLRYRSAKFLRRNRVSASIAAASVTLLAITAAALIHSSIVTRRERATAERRLTDVRSLAHSYIFDLIPQLDGIPGTLKVRSEVVQRALGYLEAMSKEKTSDPEMQRELANGYFTMGRLQGAFYTISLGDRDSGWDLMNRGLALQRQLVAGNPANLADRARLMVTLRETASMLATRGDIAGAHSLYQESWDAAQPILAAGPGDKAFFSAAGSAWYLSMSYSGLGMWNLADPEHGLEYAHKAEALTQQYAAAHPEVSGTEAYITMWCSAKAAEGDALVMLGRLDDALALYPKLLAMVDHEPLRQDVRSIGGRRLLHDRYARLQLAKGNLAAANELSKILQPEDRKDRREAGKNLWDDFNNATTAQWDAVLDWRNGQHALALKEMESTLKSFRTLGKAEPDLTWPQIDIVEGIEDFAQLPGLPPEQVEAFYNESIAITSTYAAAHPTVLSARLNQAQAHLGLMRLAAAQHHSEAVRRNGLALRDTLQPVLAAHPTLPAATALIAKADALR